MNMFAEVKLVVFDLDRTLFDWDKAQSLAQEEVNLILAKHQLGQKEFWKVYQKVNDLKLHQLANQEISQEEYLMHRYHDTLKYHRYHDTLKYFGVTDVHITEDIHH